MHARTAHAPRRAPMRGRRRGRFAGRIAALPAVAVLLLLAAAGGSSQDTGACIAAFCSSSGEASAVCDVSDTAAVYASTCHARCNSVALTLPVGECTRAPAPHTDDGGARCLATRCPPTAADVVIVIDVSTSIYDDQMRGQTFDTCSSKRIQQDLVLGYAIKVP